MRNRLAISLLALVLLLTLVLFLFQEQLQKLGNFGYLGAFLISLFTNASIFLPMPSLVLLLPLGAAFNPLLIGISAGFGGALGEMTAYLVGYTGRGIWKDNPNYAKAAGWLQKWGMVIVFLYSVSPMPFDLMGIVAGNLKFSVWKFYIACLPGKIIKYIVIAYAGALGWELFMTDPVFRNNLYAGVSGAVAVGLMLGLALLLEKRTRRKD